MYISHKYAITVIEMINNEIHVHITQMIFIINHFNYVDFLNRFE